MWVWYVWIMQMCCHCLCVFVWTRPSVWFPFISAAPVSWQTVDICGDINTFDNHKPQYICMIYLQTEQQSGDHLAEPNLLNNCNVPNAVESRNCPNFMQPSYWLPLLKQPTYDSLYGLQNSNPHLTPWCFKICFHITVTLQLNLRKGPFLNDFQIVGLKWF
jgi:hypothetical protein